MNANREELLKVILPTEVFEYFDIVRLDIDDKTIDIYLDELNLPPKQHQKEKLTSKGFIDSITIQDFPLRNKAVYLHVRRRKWQIESSGKIISNTWDLTEKGSRYTKDFATFLKGLLG